MPAFWHWFVAAGTILFIIWCIWLIGWSAKQGPTNKSDADLTGHKWDGDLEEWNNPAPKWWLYLYFITVFWGIGYLIAFPGLGNFEGVLGWSQEKQYQAEQQAAVERFEPIYAGYAEMEFETLTENADAMRLGASLYSSYCTTCHGSDARGAPGYPNLTDGNWIWGNSEQQIVTTLKLGRNAVMPALGAALGGDEGIDDMVTYVRSLSGLAEPGPAAAATQAKFVALCSACHGMDGKGNQMLGAANLTDDAWLYGSSAEDVRYTLVNGRNGVMPAHGELLGENRTKILAAYVYSLGSGE